MEKNRWLGQIWEKSSILFQFSGQPGLFIVVSKEAASPNFVSFEEKNENLRPRSQNLESVEMKKLFDQKIYVCLLLR